MEELLKKFRRQWQNENKNLIQLAHTWHELSKFEGARERVKEEFGIADSTLEMLDKIDAKLMYPTLAWQTRGLMRIGKMPYADQRRLIAEGVDVLVKGVVEKLRLNQLSNEQVCQVVTSHGRIRPVDEQQEPGHKPRKPKPPVEFNSRGIHFRRGVTRTEAQMIELLDEYRKWKASRGKRR